MRVSVLLRLLVIGALSWSAGGCSRPMAQFSAVVVRGSRPISGAEVIIEPDPSGPGSAMALTANDGKCLVDLGGRAGFAPGKYKITITCFETDTGDAVPEGEQGQVLKQNGKAVRKAYVISEDLLVGPNNLTLDLEKAEPVKEEEPSAPAI